MRKRLYLMANSNSAPSSVSTQDTPAPSAPSVVTEEAKPVETAEEEKQAASSEEEQTTDDSATPDTDNQDKPKRNRRVERKIKRMSAKIATLEAEKAAEAKRAAELEAQLDEARKRAPPVEKPKLSQFNTEEEFAEAWEAYQTAKAAPAPKPKPTPEPPRSTISIEDREAFQRAGRDRHGNDFIEAWQNEALPVSDVMGEFIIESDVGPEIYLYLHKHPDESKEIFDESPVEVVRRLQELEREVAGTKPEKNLAKGKKTSKAPPPGPKLETGDSNPSASLEDMNMDEYVKRRRAQERNR